MSIINRSPGRGQASASMFVDIAAMAKGHDHN